MKSLLIVLLFSLTGHGYSEDKVKIHFYPQVHSDSVEPSASEYLQVLVYQLKGMLELYDLVEKNPDLPIFAEILLSNKEGTRFSSPIKNDELALSLRNVKYEDLATHNVASLLDALDEDSAKKVYFEGLVLSLNAIRVNSGRKPLNLIPTVESDIANTIHYFYVLKRQFNKTASSQTNNRITLVPLTFLASSLARRFYSGSPSPLAMSLLVGTIDYFMCSNQLSKEREKYGLESFENPKSQENKAIMYYMMTYRENFVRKQMEKYVREHPEVKEVYLTFGKEHKFQELQSSDLLEFIDPPKFTEDLPVYEEGFEEVIERLLRARPKL